MQRTKKGTGTKPAPHTQPNHNRAEGSCLLLFMIFLVLIFAGEYSGNETLSVFGMGIGTAVSAILAVINLREDK